MSADLATVVKDRRTQLDLSARQLPGIDVATVSRIESGKLGDPKFSTVQKLAGALNLTLDELAGGPASAVRMIPLKDIEADIANPRTVDVADSVDAEFVESIRSQGLLQAITVRAIADQGDGTRWRVAFGGRRYAALVHLHGPRSATLVPCRITEAEGPQLLLQQLVENVARADMNPADLATAIGRLVADGTDTATLASALQKGRRWVQEQASVGRYLVPENIKSLREGHLSISQAVALAAERDPQRQFDLATKAVMQGLSEDDIRAAIADAKQAADDAEAEKKRKDQPGLFGGDPGDDADDDRYDPDAENARIEREQPVAQTGWKRWKHARGYFRWRLLRYKDDQPHAGLYVTQYDVQWRRAGATIGGGHGGTIEPNASPSLSMAATFFAAWHEFHVFAVKADQKTLTKALIPWLAKGLKAQGAEQEEVNRLEMRLQRRVLDKLEPAAAPAPKKRQPPPKPVTLKELQKVPTWAKPITHGYFVVMEGGKATLVRGWKQLATVMFAMYGPDGQEDHDCLRGLGARKDWADDTAGKPYDFAGIVYRITDLKCRGPR